MAHSGSGRNVTSAVCSGQPLSVLCIGLPPPTGSKMFNAQKNLHSVAEAREPPPGLAPLVCSGRASACWRTCISKYLKAQGSPRGFCQLKNTRKDSGELCVYFYINNSITTKPGKSKGTSL